MQERLRQLVAIAVERLREESILPGEAPSIELERTNRPEHGDFSTNLALALAHSSSLAPRALADEIVERLPETDFVAKVEVADPGFINFFLTHSWLHDTIVEIVTRREEYGRSRLGKGTRVQVEYGSPNPTGPVHIGTARNIAYGDVLANVLGAAGYSVERENYLNDAGAQIDLFGRSLEARYLQALGKPAELPEAGYAGAYLVRFGSQLAETVGASLIGKSLQIREWGLEQIVQMQRRTVERLGVHYDHWMSERSLHESGKVTAAIDRLREAGHTYEAEGALWFRASAFGAAKDRVLVRSSGDRRPTYLAADTAYLLDKLERGFDNLIYLWGADHHATVASLVAVARALGVEQQVEIIIYQLVSFTGGRMSKRTGALVELDELLDEVGVDAARFTFLTRSPDSSMEFDFDLAKAQSQDNPVYYVQYAHARICSILRYASERAIALAPLTEVELSELVHESEHELIRKLAEYSELIELSARLRAPYRLTTYCQEVAALFHAFYRDCRVVSEDLGLTQARLWLAEASRQVLANALSILGVSAPEKM